MGGDPVAIKMNAKTLVQARKGRDRLYTTRGTLMAAASEISNQIANMRLADSMQKSAEVMSQLRSLTNVPELQESMKQMGLEMFKAGLIDEMIDEGMQDLEGPDVEEEAEAEISKVLDELAIDAKVILAKPGEEAAGVQPTAAAPIDSEREREEAELLRRVQQVTS